jgi:hypothetical protein
VQRSLRAVRQAGNERPALQAVKPYFAMMFSGWLIYAGLNAILLVDMAANGAVTVNQPWDDFAINLLIGLVLLPVALAFSVRMFPLYLRLPAPNWPVRQIGLAYLIFFLLLWRSWPLRAAVVCRLSLASFRRRLGIADGIGGVIELEGGSEHRCDSAC